MSNGSVMNETIKLRLQRIEDVEGGLIVYASGFIDTYNSLHFRKSVEKAIEMGFIRIVFELGAVRYMSSTGIGCFPHFLRMVKVLNGDLVLSHVQPNVYEVFSLLGLSQFFVFKNGLDESLAHFGKEHATSFPRIFKCPNCRKRLNASKAGRFRCAECKTILVIDEAARVALG